MTDLKQKRFQQVQRLNQQPVNQHAASLASLVGVNPFNDSQAVFALMQWGLEDQVEGKPQQLESLRQAVSAMSVQDDQQAALDYLLHSVDPDERRNNPDLHPRLKEEFLALRHPQEAALWLLSRLDDNLAQEIPSYR